MFLTDGAARGLRPLLRFRARDWSRQAVPLHVFGGRPLLEAELPHARVTGSALLLTLDLDLSDPCLAALGVTSVDRLAILASHRVEDPDGALVVRHHDRGRRLELLAEPTGTVLGGMPEEMPQLPVDLEPISEAEAAVDLVAELPDEPGPMHRVGGRPPWLTHPLDPPACPITGAPMSFVACIDTIPRFSLGDREVRLAFGDGGILYVFWSDAAAVSSAIVQS